MEIAYLTKLRDNPSMPVSTGEWHIEPISLQEIEHLEGLYNYGNPFPKALQELLFLAGNFCYVLDYGIYDRQQKVQEYVRKRMANKSRIIARPFFAVDIYNVGDQFIFIYLDEGENPQTYEGHYYFDSASDDEDSWISPLMCTLSELIDHGIDRVKEGRNPF